MSEKKCVKCGDRLTGHEDESGTHCRWCVTYQSDETSYSADCNACCASKEFQMRNKFSSGFHRMVHFLVSRLPIPFKTKADQISKEPCWCIAQNGYLYIADTLCCVVLLAFKEWKDDKHIVG